MILSQRTLQLILELGAPADKLAAVLRAIDEDISTFQHPKDEQAERRRQKDRERHRVRRIPQTSAESADPYPLKDAPTPLSSRPVNNQNPYPPPLSPPTLAADDFEEFWQAWPDKRNRGAAKRAWPAARRKAGLAAILAGVPNVELTHAWLEGHRVHASTWLNGERWLDPPENHARAPPMTGGMIAAASDELAFRIATGQVNGHEDRNSLRNQSVVIALPTPAARSG